MPERIQLKRTKGWRKPEGAIVVARPGRWGNPFKPAMVINRVALRQGIVETYCQSPAHAVECYRKWLKGQPFLVGGHNLAPRPPTVDDIRAALRGHDLACWCPPDKPCHADVLLEIANA